MNVCFDCGVRLRKNEGVIIFIYTNIGPQRRRVCDICNDIRYREYKNKYLKNHSRLMSWNEVSK